jgi:hypothetical protein
MTQPPSIELTIVAARRPSLLARTLESFQQHLFRHFKFSNASINIDPIWGDESEMKECIRVMQQYFPNARAFTPDAPSYCRAVKRLWSKSTADFIFHLEDDWMLMEDVDPSILDRFNDTTLAQVSLMAKEKNWDCARRGDYHYIKRRDKIFGLVPSPIRKRMPNFTVSPAFTRGEFARHWASLMDESLDPEKQAHSGVNAKLEKYVRPYRNYLYSGKQHYHIAVDTGREWRDARHIQKITIKGTSTWVAVDPTSPPSAPS